MSRIGLRPIPLPQGVTVQFEGQHITVHGPLGTLERELVPDMQVTQEGDTLVVRRPSDSKRHKAFHGLTRSLVANMVIGVSEGYRKDLEIHGVGYKAQMIGDAIEIQVGYSHPVRMEPPAGIKFTLEGAQRVGVQGIDKELVGEVAARIRAIRKPEPYLGKGIRYAGEQIRRKAGKAGKVG
ncbi:MAG: 50S ribosomal protein L6 [Chloroflexi bacterium]|nr:50S ribosomal protein L6 [Chloroflexota bacterium]MBU1750904.1 50S ribosomal protein L6 [Chloroflexota bacterium]MBU1879647.1 50S ribosomal protein L6 [Chloroflexota bacterium]